jgi:hypothetical protein
MTDSMREQIRNPVLLGSYFKGSPAAIFACGPTSTCFVLQSLYAVSLATHQPFRQLPAGRLREQLMMWQRFHSNPSRSWEFAPLVGSLGRSWVDLESLLGWVPVARSGGAESVLVLRVDELHANC